MQIPLPFTDFLYFSVAFLGWIFVSTMENIPPSLNSSFNFSSSSSPTFYSRDSNEYTSYPDEVSIPKKLFYCHECDITYIIAQLKKCNLKFHTCGHIYCYKCQSFHFPKFCKFQRRPFEVLETKPNEYYYR